MILTLANIFLISAVYMLFQIMFISILHFKFPAASISILISSFFLLVTGLTCYGSGIYITSVVLEAFTLPNLRRVTAFKTQFIATHLFHSPISHFLIYSGYISALFSLALLELLSTFELLTNLPISLSAIPVGIIFAVAQIYNRTYPYQLVTSLFLSSIYLLLSGFIFSFTRLGTMGLYFSIFSLSLSGTLLGYFLYQEVKIRKIFQ